MRVFTAIELDAAARAALAETIAALRPVLGGVRWTRTENLHLTVRFLGEVEADRIGPVREALDEAATPVAPLALRLGGPAIFPDARRPAVLVVNVDGDPAAQEALQGLVRRFEMSLRALGFAPERRAYRSHVTIGRVDRRPKRRRRVAGPSIPTGPDLEQVLAGTDWPQRALTVNEVVLFESALRPGGPIYTAIGRSPLGG